MITPATPATFAALWPKALPGDTLTLAPGSYGDLMIRGKACDPPLRIIATDPAQPPVFNTVGLVYTSGVIFEDVVIAYKPTLTTLEATPVLRIDQSSRVSWLRGEISSGPAVNGLAPDGTTIGATNTGNVVGYPCGRVSVTTSEDVLIEGVNIHHLGRAVNLGVRAKRITIRGCDIHHTRRTAILGGASDLTIENNQIHDFSPWELGKTPYGDHCDFIALWTDATNIERNVRIVGNRMVNGAATTIMGVWFAGPAGFDNVEFRDNYLAGTDHQGLMMTSVRGGSVTGNTLTGRAGIILRDGVTGVTGANNVYSTYSDFANGATGNLIAPPVASLIPPPDPKDVRIAELEGLLAASVVACQEADALAAARAGELAQATARIAAARLALQ